MALDGFVSPDDPRRFVGESRWLRALMLGIMGFGVMVLFWDWPGGEFSGFALSCIAAAALMVRIMPWRFEVRDEGLHLWFALGRRRFLLRDDITVRVNPGSPV